MMDIDLLPRDGLVLCAVSGGIDSMYLLCQLQELDFTVAAGHFNHGLRGEEADRDESFVRNFCYEKGIPFYAGHGDVHSYASQCHIGLEEAARALRYEFLEKTADEIGALCIATAHTADDNAETILMNLTRGAGLQGLSGIPPVRGHIVRPMLGTTRKEAQEWLKAHGIDHVEDSTNAENDYTRNRIRHCVIPLLEKENPAFSAAVSRAANNLREDESYLSGLASEFVNAYSKNGTVPLERFLALPGPISRRVVRLMAGRALEETHVLSVLKVAREGGLADVPGMRVGREGDNLVFGIVEREMLPDRILIPGNTLELPEAELWVRSEIISQVPKYVYKSFNIFFFKYENIYGNIKITSRKPSDSYRPAGRGCTKTLKSLFLEAGIPVWKRQCVPVLRDETGILGVYGFPAAERVAAVSGDTDVLKLEFFRNSPGQEEPKNASGC